jgi:hypothetical protein
MVARTWPRALPGAVGPEGRETRRFCSTVGRSGFCSAVWFCSGGWFCSAVGRIGWCSEVRRVGAMVSICFLTRLFEPSGRALVASAGQPLGGDRNLLTLDFAVATQMLVQLALRDIGQVTDI